MEEIENNVNMNEMVEGENKTHGNSMEAIANNVNINEIVEGKNKNHGNGCH